MAKIQVGFSKIEDPKTKNERVCKYSDVPTNKDKWVENLNFLPIPFDIMHLRVKDRPKNISGWWTGQNWEGLRLKDNDIILKWKRNQDYD